MISHFTLVWLFATLWTVACQAPLSRGFSRQERQSGLPCPRPGHLPDLCIERVSLASAGGFLTTSTTWGAQVTWLRFFKRNRLFEFRLQIFMRARCLKKERNRILKNYLLLLGKFTYAVNKYVFTSPKNIWREECHALRNFIFSLENEFLIISLNVFQ